MYTERDLAKAQGEAKRTAILSGAILALGIALLVCALIVRGKALALVGLILPAMAAYFVFDLWCSPRLKYLKFLRDMQSGRSHRQEGEIVSVGEKARMSEEGVPVYDVMVRPLEGEQDTLFYWDAQRERPAIAPGRAMEITSYGRYITQIESARG